jgi:hypothetical protein
MNDAMLIASLWLSAKAQRGRAGKSVVKFFVFLFRNAQARREEPSPLPSP